MLKILLSRSGLSQRELASLLGVHVNTVSSWATSRVKLPQYAISYLNLHKFCLELRPIPCAKCAKIKEIVNETV